MAGIDWLRAAGYFPHRRHESPATSRLVCRMRRSIPRALREACAMAQILDFIEAELPDGFQTKVGERGIPPFWRTTSTDRSCSRALSSSIAVDSGRSNQPLDVATEAKLLEALRSLTGKLTLVVAAHRLSAVARLRSGD